MKKKLNVLLMLTSFLCLGINSHSNAHEGVGHGGGGEWFVIKCDSYISGGQKLSLSMCLSGDTNEHGFYEIIPCESEQPEFVTIERQTAVATQAYMTETIKIPGRLFNVNWSNEEFSLKMNDSIAGSLNLVRLGSYEEDKGTSLELSLPTMKHKLKSISCSFGSN